MVEITLGADPATGGGGIVVPVYPQRHAYLTNRLGRFLADLSAAGQGMTVDSLLSAAGEQTYRLLVAVCPTVEQRMPEWEFRGFGSREALEQGAYDETQDRSPSIPEIREAIRVASQVCGLDILKHLKGLVGLVDPTILKALVNEQVLNAIESASTISLSSPSESGASA